MLRQWSARRERVSVNPVYPSPNVDWGYDVADHTAIHPDLGHARLGLEASEGVVVLRSGLA